MPLSAGDRVGPHEILAPIGAGGMGEVYRAWDSKLEREIAIKILPASLASDPERLSRFEREAKVLASLNHTNIAQIFGLEESDGTRALTMELVPGENLAQVLKRGPLPIKKAIACARQMADAFEAAHEKGITHRDLKPANVMITPDGVVKVLDFGLATVSQPGSDENTNTGDPELSPTMTLAATMPGTILGTAGYMSPEQASGARVDKRSDIWAFGVVLFEMLTGQRLFTGDRVAHILADVLRGPIDFSRLPPETPSAIRNLLKRCLDRDVRQRLRDIGEARVILEAPLTEASETSTSGAEAQRGLRSAPHSKMWIAAASVLFAATAGLAFSHFREKRTVVEVTRFQIPAPENTTLGSRIGSGFHLSPSGQQIAFIAFDRDGGTSIWVRSMDAVDARRLAGTEGATAMLWSPDSRLLAFGIRGKLEKIDASGGPIQTLCDYPD